MLDDQLLERDSDAARSPAPASGAPWIVVLGANPLNAGLQDVARRSGSRLLVVDWNASPPFTGDEHICVDIKDCDRVLAAVRSRVRDLRFAYTSSDVGTETVARIHAAYGLCRPTSGALALARHKPAMNAAWRAADLGRKRFSVCTNLGQLIEFDGTSPRGCVVKPAASSSSRGVTVIEPGDGSRLLAAALARAARNDPAGEVLAEEYVHGHEFSVEMVGDSTGQVHVLAVARKYHSANAGRNRVASKLHYNPPDVPMARQARIGAFAARCFHALGLRCSLGHLELIERWDGTLEPIELGARSSGYIATHVVDAVTQAERTMLGTYEHVVRGGRLTDQRLRARRSAMLFYYDFPDAVGCRGGTSLTQFLPSTIRSIASDRTQLVRGRRFRRLEDDTQRPGFEILVGERDALTVDAVATAEAIHRREFLWSALDKAVIEEAVAAG